MKASPTIWIVDDDQMYCTLLARQVRQLQPSASVLLFYDGMDALEALQRVEQKKTPLPHLLFLDRQMGYVDGLEFLKESQFVYQRLFTEARILMVTSSIDERDRQHVQQFPAVIDYLTKPLQLSQIRILLERYVPVVVQ